MLNVKVSHDVEQYKEPVLGPFDARESIFIATAVIFGAVTVMAAYFLLHLPLTLCGYVVIPVIAPIIFLGFGKKDGLSFLEQQKKKKTRVQKPLFYRSTENSFQYRKSVEKGELEKTKISDNKFEQSVKKAKYLFTIIIAFIVITVCFAVVTAIQVG